MICSHCFCKKEPVPIGKPPYLLCCRCGARMQASCPHLHRLYPTWEEERQFREAKERYGIKD